MQDEPLLKPVTWRGLDQNSAICYGEVYGTNPVMHCYHSMLNLVPIVEVVLYSPLV